MIRMIRDLMTSLLAVCFVINKEIGNRGVLPNEVGRLPYRISQGAGFPLVIREQASLR